MYRRRCRGESREKHHLVFQEEMRDTDQELHKNGHHEAWQGLSPHGLGGSKYWDPVRVPHVFCLGPDSVERPGGWGEVDTSN